MNGSRMRTAATAAGTRAPKGRAAGRAEQLVRRRATGRGGEGATGPAVALAALWSRFDAAWERANQALDADGVAARIAPRNHDRGRCYRTAGSGGEGRSIAILLLPSGGHGQDMGARIGAGSARASMYLVPTIGKRRPIWQVAATRRPLDAGVVQDLFLCSARAVRAPPGAPGVAPGGHSRPFPRRRPRAARRIGPGPVGRERRDPRTGPARALTTP